MKVKKKSVENKAEIGTIKGKEGLVAMAIFLAFILLIVIFPTNFSYTPQFQPQNPTINPAPSQLKAAIVDQLSLTCPNQTFIETATNILKQAGYTVDYYPGENVTVEFYRKLPTHDYSLIILRAHSTLRILYPRTPRPDFTPERPDPIVIFFTSERFDPYKYFYEVLTDELLQVAYTPKLEAPTYFAITPAFVRQSMEGDFQNTTIIVMGCDGLTYSEMARALIRKGAKAYIGWNESVSASHTDQATTQLLQNLITEKQTIKKAVDNTMKEVGADPVYTSVITYYPLDAEQQTAT